MQLKRDADDTSTADTVTDDPPRRSRAAQLRERFTGSSRPVDRADVREREDGRDETDDRPVLTERDVRVMTRGQDLGVYRARRRFGGFDAGAAIAGLLAAVGLAALVGGIAGAIGTIGYQLDVQRDEQTLSTGGFLAGLAVLLVAFLVGGWVAGRSARYDGGRNGLASAILFLVLSAGLAAIGAWFGEQYDVLNRIQLPQWFHEQNWTALAVVSAVVGVVVMLAAGWIGGVMGSWYHRRVDNYLAEYAQGGRPVTAETLMATSRRH
jgi:hypothetical protein